jgi:hypothetical protein
LLTGPWALRRSDSHGVNHGVANSREIQLFVSMLLRGRASRQGIPTGNQPPADGAIDLSDLDSFVTCLLGGRKSGRDQLP